MKEYHFRASDLVEFAACRRKYMYHKVRGWEVPSLGRSADMGTVIHAGLEHFYNLLRDGRFFHNGDLRSSVGAAVATAAQSMSLKPEDVLKCEDVVMFYLEWYAKPDARNKILTVEEDVDLRLEGPSGIINIHTHFDVAFRDPERYIIIRDHKTKDALPADYSWFDLDWQMKIYQAAGWRHFCEPCAVEHNLIRREVPPGFGHRPLKNEIWDKKGRHYFKESTASKEPADYIKQFRFEKKRETIDCYEREIIEMAEEMIHAKAYIRQSSFLCGGCPYLGPCLREQDGDKLPVTLSNQIYKVN